MLNAVNNSSVIYNHLFYFIFIVFDNWNCTVYKLLYCTVLQKYSSLLRGRGPLPQEVCNVMAFEGVF